MSIRVGNRRRTCATLILAGLSLVISLSATALWNGQMAVGADDPVAHRDDKVKPCDDAVQEAPADAPPKSPLVPVTEVTQTPDGQTVTITMWHSQAALDLVKQLDEAAEKKPDDFGLLDFIQEWNANASPRPEDLGYVFYRFVKLVKPPLVTDADLEEIYRSMESGLRTFTAEYTCTRSGIFSEHTSPTRQVKLAIKPGHSLLTWLEDREQGWLGQTMTSADGIVREFHIIENADSVAFIRRMLNGESLIDRDNPLIKANIRFPNLFLNRYNEGLWVTLVGKMPPIIERESTFNGHRCITVGQPGSLTYLCPELNYAVVGTVGSKYQIDRKTNRYVEDPDYQICRNEDFQEFANGLWLPKRSIQQVFRGGKLAGEEIVAVDKMEVNADLPDSVFTDVLPNRMLVTDQIARKTYRIGGPNQPVADSSDPAEPVEPVETWKWFTNVNGERTDVILKLKFIGDKVTGTIRPGDTKEKEIEDGTFRDDELSFTVTREPNGKKVVSKYQGKIEDDQITGTVEITRNDKTNSFTWKAKREKSPASRRRANQMKAEAAEGKYRCSPSSLFFGSLNPGQSATRIIRVTTSDKDTSLENLELSSTSNVVTIKKQLTDPQLATLEITYTAPTPGTETVENSLIKGMSAGESQFEISCLTIQKK